MLNEIGCATQGNLTQNRLSRKSANYGVLLLFLYIHPPGENPSWVPASPEDRNTSYDRHQNLETVGHTDVPDIKGMWTMKVTVSHICMPLEVGTKYSSRTWSLWRKSLGRYLALGKPTPLEERCIPVWTGWKKHQRKRTAHTDQPDSWEEVTLL